MPDNLRGVELATAGMEWRGSNGPCTITLGHLADAVVACNDDPHVQPPRIRLGHESQINGDGPRYDPFAALGDAEPSFGVFRNLRTINDGAVLVGDADNVPAWLAEIAASAYPNRSVEAVWDIASANTDVQTDGGRRYQMVLTAVALLGVYLPAVSDLEDLQALMADGPSALASKTDLAGSAAMSVSYDTVRHRFNWSWAVDREGNDFDGDTTWWWARDVRFDPNEVVADDEEGNLWSVPFSTDGEDAITFAEPARVRQTYVPVAASMASFARPDKQAERPAAIAASKPSRKPAASAATTQAASARREPEGVNVNDDVRQFLVARGIDPDTATEVQINAATVLMAEQPATTEAPEAETADEPTAEAEVETPEVERVPVAASADPIQATKDQAMADMSARLEAMTQRENARLAAETKDRRDRKVSAAVGKQITPAEREHYRGLMDIDEDRTDALLSALPANRCPLDARAEIPDPTADPALSADELPANVSLLNPTERAALKARRAV